MFESTKFLKLVSMHFSWFTLAFTQTLETVNVDLELDYLHLLKTNFNNYT